MFWVVHLKTGLEPKTKLSGERNETTAAAQEGGGAGGLSPSYRFCPKTLRTTNFTIRTTNQPRKKKRHTRVRLTPNLPHARTPTMQNLPTAGHDELGHAGRCTSQTTADTNRTHRRWLSRAYLSRQWLEFVPLRYRLTMGDTTGPRPICVLAS